MDTLTKCTLHTELTIDLKHDLDLEFWGDKIPSCTNSHAEKYLFIRLFGSISFTFGVTRCTSFGLRTSGQGQTFTPINVVGA